MGLMERGLLRENCAEHSKEGKSDGDERDGRYKFKAGSE
jgi:hypothetical protein